MSNDQTLWVSVLNGSLDAMTPTRFPYRQGFYLPQPTSRRYLKFVCTEYHGNGCGLSYFGVE